VTKHERAIKDRMWLKTRRFAITNSLATKLAGSTLTTEEQEWCCYIQNKVLIELREQSWAGIHCRYFKDKIGTGYKKWIKKLCEWEELVVNNKYLMPGGFSSGTTKKYWIPSAALATGVVIRDFKADRVRLTKDNSKFSAATPWVEFIFQNLKQLSIAKDLLKIDDAVEDSDSHDYAKKVFSGEFNCHYGNKSRRLFHSIIQMPKVGRANLIWRDTGKPLEFEFDIKSCHPVLLLTLITDATEREIYCRVLNHDIYDVIRVQDNIKDTRDGCKTEFLSFINYDKKSHAISQNNYVYKFFKHYFPILTETILKKKKMALYLQNLEAQIMVDELGKLCMAKNIWFFCANA